MILFQSFVILNFKSLLLIGRDRQLTRENLLFFAIFFATKDEILIIKNTQILHFNFRNKIIQP